MKLAEVALWIEWCDCFSHSLAAQHTDTTPSLIFVGDDLPIKSLIDYKIGAASERNAHVTYVFAASTKRMRQPILVPSGRKTNGSNLVIFPRNQTNMDLFDVHVQDSEEVA